MISSGAREAVAKATPARLVSLIVHFDRLSELKAMSRIADRALRKRKINNLYAKAKRPLLEALSIYRDDGLRVVEGLNGTPDLILEGPGSVWRQVLAESPTLLEAPEFEIRANTVAMVDA